jgi:hypothetical protein
VTWALKPDTIGGMYSIDANGAFAKEPDLAREGTGSSFTPSPGSTTHTSPRQTATRPGAADSDDDELPLPERKRRGTAKSQHGNEMKRRRTTG